MWDGKLDWFPSFALVRGTTVETEHDAKDFAFQVADPLISSEPIFAALNSFTLQTSQQNTNESAKYQQNKSRCVSRTSSSSSLQQQLPSSKLVVLVRSSA